VDQDVEEIKTPSKKGKVSASENIVNIFKDFEGKKNIRGIPDKRTTEGKRKLKEV